MEKPPHYPRFALAEVTALNILKCTGISKPPVPIKKLLERYSTVHLYENTCDLPPKN